jgi:hypothetical protein
LAPAAGAGGPIQAGAACPAADAPAALGVGPEAEAESAAALVGRRDEGVDGLVLAGEVRP